MKRVRATPTNIKVPVRVLFHKEKDGDVLLGFDYGEDTVDWVMLTPSSFIKFANTLKSISGFSDMDMEVDMGMAH